jgi:hypothetical protein
MLWLVVGAYLNADIKRDDDIVSLKAEVAHFLLDLKPEWVEYLNKDRSMTVVLKKALYRCIES